MDFRRTDASYRSPGAAAIDCEKPTNIAANHANAEPKVLYELLTKWDRFALELKEFIPQDSDEPKQFFWLSRSKKGAKSTGVSIRKREMLGLIAALQRILADDDGSANTSSKPEWMERMHAKMDRSGK